MSLPREAVVVTAIGTVKGRVSWPEFCLGPAQREARELVEETVALGQAPFDQIEVVLDLGAGGYPPEVRPLRRRATLEVIVGLPLHHVRRLVRDKDCDTVCSIVRVPILEAVASGLRRHGLPAQAVEAALQAEHQS